MKKSNTTPFMEAPDYGQSLSGFSVNLLSADLERALLFQRDVLCARQFVAREHSVEIIVEHSGELPDVRVARTEIEQMVINLVQNAIDSIVSACRCPTERDCRES